MDASFGDGWFYEGAGIYRHVWLTKTDALHLGKWESYVRSESERECGGLSWRRWCRTREIRPSNAKVKWQIVDAAGKTVATAESPAQQSVAADGSVTFTATAKLANPALLVGGDSESLLRRS